jgi:hypothetical protein
MRLIGSFSPLRRYERRAAVWLVDRELLVPYPIQNHLHALGREDARAILAELASAPGGREARTLAEWLTLTFGETLTRLFFGPFHERYTAGLWTEIAPPDPAKTPVNLADVRRGAEGEVPPAGYNTTFWYPEEGLDAVVAGLAAACDLRLGCEAIAVDPRSRTIYFADGSEASWTVLVSSVPLNRMVKMAGLDLGEPDPFTSVLVVNVGARRGARCPDVHWVYVPVSASGFHRVGFYSNVDEAFLPKSRRGRGSHVSAYVELACRGGDRPDAVEVERLCDAVLGELADWGWIGEVEVMDPTWVDVAYTWVRPGSSWRTSAIRELAGMGIYQVGRYGRWAQDVGMQGLAQSIHDGLAAAELLR